MMKTKLFALGVLAALAGGLARAESTDIDSVTIGAMTEAADLVVVAEPGPWEGGVTASVHIHVVETLRSRETAPTDFKLWLPWSETPHAGPCLLFLRLPKEGESTGYKPVATPWGVRDASDGAVKPLVDYARRYAAALDKDGKLAKPAELAALLVESLGSPASGIPGTAGRDLVRRFEELVPLMTPAQRQWIDAALARPRKADLDLAGIIDAAGVAGTNAADEVLVARLVDPATRTLRLNVTAALARHSRPELVPLLARRLEGATPQQRADVVNALGRIDQRDAEAPLVAALGDGEPIVRVEAAHSLGLLARFVRAPRPGASEAPSDRLDAALVPLTRALAAAKTDAEKRALVWSMAQLDTAPAWDALKKLRDEAEDAAINALAAEYVLRPRVALILE